MTKRPKRPRATPPSAFEWAAANAAGTRIEVLRGLASRLERVAWTGGLDGGWGRDHSRHL